MARKIDQRSVLGDVPARAEQRHERDDENESRVHGKPNRDGGSDALCVAIETLDHLRSAHHSRQGERYHAEQRKGVVKAAPAGRQGGRVSEQGRREQDAHDADHRAHGKLFAYAHELHADKHHARAQHIENEHTDDIGQAEPAAEHRRRARQKRADVNDDGNAEKYERRPCENGFYPA